MIDTFFSFHFHVFFHKKYHGLRITIIVLPTLKTSNIIWSTVCHIYVVLLLYEVGMYYVLSKGQKHEFPLSYQQIFDQVRDGMDFLADAP